METLEGPHGSLREAANLLSAIRKKGVQLWCANGELRYTGPRNSITAQEIDEIRAAKQQILALLSASGASADSKPILPSNIRVGPAPLSFSQHAHWALYHLGERPAIRQIAAALRLRGRLRINVLRQSLDQVIRRHDALRTRIVIRDGVAAQEILQDMSADLRIHDLAQALLHAPPEERSRALEGLIKALILQPIELATGPLLGTSLIKVDHDEHVFIVALEHIISDAYSLGVFLRDLFALYVEKVSGSSAALPFVRIQLSDYARWQAENYPSWWQKHQAYWNDKAIRWPRTRFPSDGTLQPDSSSGWSGAQVTIGRKLRSELVQWSREHGTTLALAVFTAYVGFLMRWCNVREATVLFQTDGRVAPELENTIGCFTSALYLHIDRSADHTCFDFLKRVTTAYCEAREYADASYLESRSERPEFTRSSCFNWVPHGSRIDLSALEGTGEALSCEEIAFEHPMLAELERDTEPFLVLFDSGAAIDGRLYYPLNRFSAGTMRRFAIGLEEFIQDFLTRSGDRLESFLIQNLYGEQ